MKKIGAKGQKWLKCLHLVCVCMWVGGAVTLVLMNFFMSILSGPELHAANSAKVFVDYYMIIPGANGCLATGLVYSIFTNWGWFKHNWVSVKWAITVFGIVFGTFWLGPWVDSLLEMTVEHGHAALEIPEYIRNQRLLNILGTAQTLTVIFALFISVLKPWKRRSRSQAE